MSDGFACRIVSCHITQKYHTRYFDHASKRHAGSVKRQAPAFNHYVWDLWSVRQFGLRALHYAFIQFWSFLSNDLSSLLLVSQFRPPLKINLAGEQFKCQFANSRKWSRKRIVLQHSWLSFVISRHDQQFYEVRCYCWNHWWNGEYQDDIIGIVHTLVGTQGSGSNDFVKILWATPIFPKQTFSFVKENPWSRCKNEI